MKTLVMFFVSAMIVFSLVSCAGTQNAKWVSPNREKGIGEKDLTNKASEKIVVVVKNEDIDPFTYKGRTILKGDFFPVEIPLRDNSKEIKVRDGNGKNYKLFIESDRKSINKHIKIVSDFVSTPTEILLVKTSDNKDNDDVDLLATSPNMAEEDIFNMFGNPGATDFGVAITLKSVSRDNFFKEKGFTGVYNLSWNVWVVLSKGKILCFDWIMPGITWSVFNSNFHNHYEGMYDNFEGMAKSQFTLLKLFINRKWFEKEISRRTGGNNKKTVEEYFSQNSGVYLFVPEISYEKEKLKLYPVYSTYGGFYPVTERKKKGSFFLVIENISATRKYQIVFKGNRIMLDPGKSLCIEMVSSKYYQEMVTANSFKIIDPGRTKQHNIKPMAQGVVIFNRCPFVDKRGRAERSSMVPTFYAGIDFYSGIDNDVQQGVSVIPDSYVKVGDLSNGNENPITVY